MPRRPDAVIRPNTHLSDARRRLPSPLRPGQCLSRAELADAVNAALDRLYPGRSLAAHYVNARWVGKLERGEHRWPSDERRAALRHVLATATDDTLGLYSPRHSEPAVPDGRVGETRRDLLRGILAVASASGLLGGGAAAGRRLGATDVDRLRAVLALYRSMDYEVGGGALVDDLSRFAVAATGLLERSYSDAVAATLFASVAGVQQMAGWTAFDAGRHTTALRHFRTAERIAAAGGDRLLVARIRYCRARQLQHLRRNEQAIDVLSAAIEQVRPMATPAVIAMLLGAQATSHAALGAQPVALELLGRARDAFDRIRPGAEPEWMHYYDHGELLAQYGRVYRDLARHDTCHGAEAVAHTSDAIAAFGPGNVRSTVFNQVGLASALFLAGEPDQAVTVGHQVLDDARQLTSRRVIDRVANLRRDIGPYRHRPTVAAFIRTLPARPGTAA